MIAITVVVDLLWVFFGLLMARLVVSYVQLFARDWRPRGLVAAGLEVIFSATDPPLNLLRRVIPPLRLGSVALDLSFWVLSVVVIVLIQVLPTL